MATATDSKPLLSVRNLKKYFPIHKGILSRVVGHVKAVDDVSFDVYPNETLGLVGESGCGKTTTGRSILRLIEPSDGEVRFEGDNIVDYDVEQMRRVRRQMQIIFQDPYSSLNPRMTVEGIIGEAIEFHGIAGGDKRRQMVENLLERVGLQPSYITRYPHEFSGGQRQRLGIARALALNPSFIVCDEAVSALDVSVQAQVINLLQDLQEEFELSYLFIAHDLSVVRHISDRIAVMYLGQVMELATADELFQNPQHPYTQALLSAIPHPNPRRKKSRIILEGDVPSPINPPAGCRFHTRCPACFEACRSIVPKTIETEDGHFVKCHLYDPEYEDPALFERLPDFSGEVSEAEDALEGADGTAGPSEDDAEKPAGSSEEVEESKRQDAADDEEVQASEPAASSDVEESEPQDADDDEEITDDADAEKAPATDDSEE